MTFIFGISGTLSSADTIYNSVYAQRRKRPVDDPARSRDSGAARTKLRARLGARLRARLRAGLREGRNKVKDRWGNEVTARNPEAVEQLGDAVLGYLGARTDTGDSLNAAQEADPDLVMAHVLRGYFMHLFAHRGLIKRARASLDAAAEAADRLGATAREMKHITALSTWCDGRPTETLRLHDEILAEHPRDLIALKLAEYWHFYEGDSAGMRDSIDRVWHGWDAQVPGYGFVLGMRAFALEESGDYEPAEECARAAIDIDPSDIWAAHAGAHVMDMTDRQDEGVQWIEKLFPNFDPCNNFRYHIGWHRAVYAFDCCEFGRVIEIYDALVRPESTRDFRDITNAAALLWRLDQENVDVGDRWAELAEHSAARAGENVLVFAETHYMMALAAVGDTAAVATMLDTARAFAARDDESQCAVMRDIGLALCESIAAFRSGDYDRSVDVLYPVRAAIRLIGGSHVQRDVFAQMLITAALRAGRLDTARDLLEERTTQRPGNPLTRAHHAAVMEQLQHGSARGGSA